MTLCSKLRSEGEKCVDDYQCPISHYCWYKNKGDVKDDVRRCIELYSMVDGESFGWKPVTIDGGEFSLEDHERNGKACQSGLAYNNGDNEAKCVSASRVKFQD